MGYADKLYKESVLDIYENGDWDKDSSVKVRAVYEDGSPAYSKGIFGKQMKFPKGELPILTSKKVFWKTALKEMMLFWQHNSVKKEYFEKYNVKVWDEWFLEDNTLGKSYAYQFESNYNEDSVSVEKVFTDSELAKFKHKEAFPEYDGTVTRLSKKDFYKIEDINGVEHVIIKEYDDIGGIVSSIKKDSYKISMSGEAFVKNDSGNYIKVDTFIKKGKRYISFCKKHSELKEEDYDLIYKKWKSIIDNDNMGLIFADRWKVFDYFFEDIYYIKQYFLARNDKFKGWYLTNDYINALLDDKNKTNILSRDNANWLTFTNILDLMSYKYTNKLPKLSDNQVVNLLKDIKNNPNSRRLMTSFWNDNDVKDKALQECAWATNWRVRGGVLDLILIQRSGDIGLGIPFNQIQYYLLQNMIAVSLGLKVGEFTHQIGDLHYYDRHEGDLIKQVNEDTTYNDGKIIIESRDFFDYSFNDICINGYKSGGVHKYEVAI